MCVREIDMPRGSEGLRVQHRPASGYGRGDSGHAVHHPPADLLLGLSPAASRCPLSGLWVRVLGPVWYCELIGPWQLLSLSYLCSRPVQIWLCPEGLGPL